jgi:hypothetical protein
MPEKMETQPETVIQGCLAKREAYLAELFNDFYHNICEDRSVTYLPEDFTVTVADITKTDRVIYAELPEDQDGGRMYCMAYAFVYKTTETGGVSDAVYYTVEASDSGIPCFGKMTSYGLHSNFGDIFPTRKENIKAIYKLSRGWTIRRTK